MMMDENDNKIWIKAFKCENDIVIRKGKIL